MVKVSEKGTENEAFGIRHLAESVALESVGGGDKVLQAEIDPRVKDQIWEYLNKQGYRVTEGAVLPGKSGVEHTFDILAQRDDGFISYDMAICVISGGDRESEVKTIFNFANKAYDTGINDRILIAIPEISPEAKQLANKQRIKVIDSGKMGSLLDIKPMPEFKKEEPLKFETQDQLVAAPGLSIALIFWPISIWMERVIAWV